MLDLKVGRVNVCFKKSKVASHLGLLGLLVPLGEIVTWPSGRSALWDSRRSPVQRWEAVSSPGLELSRTPPWWGQVAVGLLPRCSGTGCETGSDSRPPRWRWTERRCGSERGASCRTRPLWRKKKNEREAKLDKTLTYYKRQLSRSCFELSQ